MKFTEAMNIYEKYDSKGIVGMKFKRKTAKDSGAVNVGLRLRMYADFLNHIWIELRNKRIELVKGKGKCCDLTRISAKEQYSHDECSFINIYPKEICKPCDFYIKKIESLDKEMELLLEAQNCLIEKAAYDDICK